MQIIDYKPGNARQIVELWRASFEHGVGIADHHPVEEQLSYFIEQVVPNSRVRTVVEGPTIVGFLASTPTSIAHLYVRVQNFRQGIGSRLVQLAKAESAGTLWLYTFVQNSNARRFYERHQFSEVEHVEAGAIKYHWAKVQRVA